ncbi:MAG: PucR family transcriptional regulator [Nocardioides sp.]
MRSSIGEVVAKTTTELTPVPDDVPPGTLRHVLEVLGPHALRLVHGDDARLDTPAGEPVVHGAGEPVDDAAGQIVMLTGGRAQRADALECIRHVAEAHGDTVVLKAWGDDLATAIDVASRAGVTLLCTPDEMAWRHLDALITAARTAAVRIGDSTEPGSSSGDLFTLVNAIAASLGGPVTIEEPNGRVMAYSNLAGQEIDEIRRLAILGRQTPERPTNASEYQAILRAAGPVFFESSDPAYADRMAIAVRAGHQTLGVIFVLCDRPKLVDGADRVLVDAARTTALHLLRMRGQHDPDRTRRSGALRGLIAGTLDEHTAAAALGLASADYVVVAAVRPMSATHLRESDAARVADLVATHGEYWHAGAACMVEAGELLLLLPLSGAHDDERAATRLRKLGADLVTAAHRSAGVELRVGFGPVVLGLADVGRARNLAGRVLDVLQKSGTPDSGSVACLQDVRAAVVLDLVRTLSALDDHTLLLDQVRDVLEHDASQGTDYGETLLTYLSCFGNVLATAQRLNVHENTARYRVRRLVEKFGVDFEAGDDTLATWLQLRTTLGASPGA